MEERDMEHGELTPEEELRPEASPEEEIRPETSPEGESQPEATPEETGPDAGQEEAGSRQKEPRNSGRELYQSLRTLVMVLGVLILMFTFVMRIIVVSGPSMENTLQNGDAMLVWSLGYTPRQGDVVVLTKRTYQEDSIVKRVIATEGQTVDIDYATGTVYVDGQPLEEDYIKEQMQIPSYGEGTNHVTVPEGCLFVMGDNRNQSADSRYSGIGIVDERCVIGRAVMVLFPFAHFGTL